MKETASQTGQNGVAIPARTGTGEGFRTYEVHQRERVGESTAKVKPAQFLAPTFAANPYPLLTILRENYPCYRNWVTNDYFITRYDDVTSVFVDEANFETRPKRWHYAKEDYGQDLGKTVDVLQSHADYFDNNVKQIAERVVGEMFVADRADLATEFAARVALELLVGWLDIPEQNSSWFIERYWQIERGAHWEPRAQQAGLMAMAELSQFFAPLLAERRKGSGPDLIATIARMSTLAGPARAEDVVATLLEWDHATLHGALANLWFLLLTEPNALQHVREERMQLKYAYLETLRHSPPVLTAQRFARHEVERFGRMLPEGALVMCSAAAANRDPRIFHEPDKFIIGRKDLCQREPRGQFRADGLASGIAFGLGAPSKHPAVPEDRPRSLYAITRDTVSAASSVLLDMTKHIELLEPLPTLRSLRLHDTYTCWSLPVRLRM